MPTVVSALVFGLLAAASHISQLLALVIASIIVVGGIVILKIS